MLQSQLWRSISPPPHAEESSALDDALRAVEGRLVRSRWTGRRFMRIAEAVGDAEPRVAAMSDDQLRAELLRMRAQRIPIHTDPLAAAALREATRRALGMRPHTNQVAGALAMTRGSLVEMATGEGKTLSIAMAAAVLAMQGRGCHVVTVNDYLAQRDSEWMAPLFDFLNLSVAHVTQDSDHTARTHAYRADATYVSNKEVAADFLRDRLRLGAHRSLAAALLEWSGPDGRRPSQALMRGLACAIIDEADSVLIDEAVTPLIISDGGTPIDADTFRAADHLAASLRPRRDYAVDRRLHEVRLTSAGRDQLRREVATDRVVRAEELVVQAICARELFLRDVHYVVEDGRVTIVDEFTGRRMPDRSWRAGLHQAVEAKEGLEIQPLRETRARISFQRFFGLYESLAGATGTAGEVATEAWRVYRLPVARLPTNAPCVRRALPDRVCASQQERREALVDEARRAATSGRPVLIGARTVQESEAISASLHAHDLDHAVLNAVRHAEEAEIVARAGTSGRVTVATNMAGRGTDIRLDPDARAAGGLCILGAERHEARRIDRQLAGRAGRQGDPGSVRYFIAIDDELYRRNLGPIARAMLPRARAMPRMASIYAALAQRAAERRGARLRREVLRTDRWLDDALAFSGDVQ